MRAGDLLRRLDERLLPRLGRTVTRMGEGPARPRALTVVAVLCAAAVLLTAVWTTDRPPTGDPTLGTTARVGVTEGQSIPGYLRTAGDELAALAAGEGGRQTYALVSLADYLAPDRLAPLLGEVAVAEVLGRVPLPGRQTQIVRIPALRVPQDVLAGMDELARRKDREAADYRARAAAVTGDAVEDRELRQVYVSGAEVAAAEAAAYRSHCSCVYAAVVRAEPTALRAVAGRPGVRGVDPAPEVDRLDRAVFSPPLPEQVDVVRPPADTGLPTAGGSPAPAARVSDAAGQVTPDATGMTTGAESIPGAPATSPGHPDESVTPGPTWGTDPPPPSPPPPSAAPAGSP
ncbi:hypothetical protein V6U90_00080 [Micromonospora sp. CPCC 206060]|uniref:hypothetical protein n=1 Tax=Micromonospora sp. CPCC 206060 TaxID=3122406 RepID=UPI002FF21DCE